MVSVLGRSKGQPEHTWNKATPLGDQAQATQLRQESPARFKHGSIRSRAQFQQLGHTKRWERWVIYVENNKVKILGTEGKMYPNWGIGKEWRQSEWAQVWWEPRQTRCKFPENTSVGSGKKARERTLQMQVAAVAGKRQAGSSGLGEQTSAAKIVTKSKDPWSSSGF